MLFKKIKNYLFEIIYNYIMFIKKFLLLFLISEYKSSIQLFNENKSEKNQEVLKLEIKNDLEIKYLKSLSVITGASLLSSIFFFNYKNKSEKYEIINLLLFLTNNLIWKLYFLNNLLYDNIYEIFIFLSFKIFFTIFFTRFSIVPLEIILGDFNPFASNNKENDNYKIFSILLISPIVIDILISLFSPIILNYIYSKKLEPFKNVKNIENSQKLLTI